MTNKLDRAIKLDIPILTEEEFMGMLENYVEIWMTSYSR